ncbi:hypothetical protein L0Z72_07775 [candidate division KSB1 bacterium]|nr:hypothetical protein [candidate division KSB1 bacterium]
MSTAGGKKNYWAEIQLMDCLEIDAYQSIITHPSNWDQIFKSSFEDKEMGLARFKILKCVRNPVAHSWGTFSVQEKLDLIAKIRYFMEKFQICGDD